MANETASARPGAADTPRGLEPGATFAGRYRIVRLLGAGGMGVVYEAELAGHRVALKILHRHLVANVQVTKRFYREAEILRRLSGEHLVALSDFGADADGRLFMALELVDGDALDRFIAVRGLPSVREGAAIARDVCAALTSAHEMGVIHRDLKPANVLLETVAHGARPRVRVCDFGLAKALKESGFASTALTDQHMVFGTPEYMSPEQVRGEECDVRADVYAAGCLLYELLTGSPPFQGKTSVATMTAHITETPPPPSRRAPERKIGKALDAVTLHAIARELDARYQTAADLGEAITHALEAPEDSTSVRPPAPTDIAMRDTAVALPHSSIPPPTPRATVRSHPNVDPLGATVVHTPSPDLLARLERARASGAVTPEDLSPVAARGLPRWVWFIVAAVATALGVALALALRS